MNKAPNSPRVRVSGLIIALIGLMAGSCAFGDLHGSYKVLPGNSTNPNHAKAIYVVFKSADREPQTGLFFMERKGSFKDQPFICNSADWSKSDEDETYSCSRLATLGKLAFEERIVVGAFDGEFCNGLREKHNTRGAPPVIPKQDQCGDAAKCSCYEITHWCWNEDDKDYTTLCDLHQQNTGNSKATCEETGSGCAPPGSGAGSGKDN